MKKEFVFRVALVGVIVFLIFQFGVKPAFLDKQVANDWARGKLTDEKGKYDVIVIGESPEGIAAAVSSARAGAKTLLLASGKDLGGDIEKCMITDLEPNLNREGHLLEKGIYQKLYNKLGSNFSIQDYKEVVTDLVSNENKLYAIYDTELKSPILENNILFGVNVYVNGKLTTYRGKRFIDATRDGKLLSACKVPYFTGSGDINMKDSYLPVKLNFEVKGFNYKKFSEASGSSLNELYKMISEYERSNIQVKIRNINFSNQGEDKTVVEGIEFYNLDVLDSEAVSNAYKISVNEAKRLAKYLSAVFQTVFSNQFNDMELFKVADKFIIDESLHFIGEHTLSVNELLNNTDFSSKIAIGSYPIDASKLADNSTSIIGYPDNYSIPLGCIVPLKIENLIMVGNKISYSSLASTSAGTMGLNIAVGESAGTVAVFSLFNKMTPRELLQDKNKSLIKQVQGILKEQGIYIPDFKISNKNSTSWCYREIQEMCSLGLIRGGIENNFNLNSYANSEDLAMLLLNGTYRTSPESYSLKLDSELRKNFTKKELTKELTGEILSDFYGYTTRNGNAYRAACDHGYINKAIQKRIKDRNVLRMDEVIYISAFNIKRFTGKEIQA